MRPDRYPRSSRYDPDWVRRLDMGPHPLWPLEELLPDLRLRPGDRVLDLGCGQGATSVFLAREAEVEVVAVDWWVSESVRQRVIDEAGVHDHVEVVHADARRLPFDDDEFDAVVSIDAFEYFGTDVKFIPGLLRVLRPGGRVAMSTPALGVDPYVQLPPVALTSLVGGEVAAWHTPDWWRRHWELSGLLTEVTARLQDGGRDDWIRWLRAAGVAGEPMLAVLTSMTPDDIGFALVTATKRPSP